MLSGSLGLRGGFIETLQGTEGSPNQPLRNRVFKHLTVSANLQTVATVVREDGEHGSANSEAIPDRQSLSIKWYQPQSYHFASPWK